jgi:hypothetical protein
MGCACIRQDVVVKNQKLFIERENRDYQENISNNDRPIQDEMIVEMSPVTNNLARTFELINQANINNNEPFLQSKTNSNFNFPEIGNINLT